MVTWAVRLSGQGSFSVGAGGLVEVLVGRFISSCSLAVGCAAAGDW